MPRWAILGSKEDEFAKRSESMLRRMGPYTVRTRKGNIEFALSYKSLKEEPLLRFSKWIRSDESYNIIDINELLSFPGIKNIDRWHADLSDLPKTSEVLDSFEGYKRFERFNRLIFYTGIKQLPEVFAKFFAPKFFGWHPGGRILYLNSSGTLHIAMAAIRVMGAAMDLADKDYDELEKIGPFRMLADIQSTGVFYVNKHLSIPLGIFLPRLYGFIGAKVNLGFIFLLDDPIQDIREPFPRSGLEFFRSEGSGLFRQNIDIDVHEIDPDVIDKYALITNQFTQDDIRHFIQKYLTILNQFLFYMIDPSNFISTDTGIWSGLIQYRAWLTFERIATELILLITDDTSALRKMALFRIFDQLSSLATKKTPEQVVFFKNLMLPQTGDSDPIRAGLETYGGQVGNNLIKILTECREDMSKTVLESIFIPGRYHFEKNIVTLANGNSISSDDYIREVIREIRNTYHGYYTHKFDNYLSMNTGNTPDSLPVLAILAYLSFLAKPQNFISRDWE